MLNGVSLRKSELYDRTWMIKARTLRGLSQYQAAEAIGISQGYYNKIENGIQLPNIRVGLTISKVLGVVPDIWLNERKIA